MNGDDDERVLNKFKEVILPPLVSALEKLSAKLATRPLGDFQTVINFLIKKALEELIEVSGAEKLEDLSAHISGQATACMVSELNSALPVNHPYIVAILDIKNEPGNLSFFCLQRQIIPGMHDCLSRNLVPIIFVDSRKEIEGGRIKITSVQFPNADDELLS